jgi:hypothetical protein
MHGCFLLEQILHPKLNFNEFQPDNKKHMKKQSLLVSLLILLLTLLMIRCSNPVSVPPDIPIETLLSVPDTLDIEDQRFVLSTDMWRDFQPISPPDGKPLMAFVFIETIDSSDISSSIDANGIYIVYNDQVWRSFFTEENLPPIDSELYRKIARDGPKWGPDVYVDVIVSIIFDNKFYLLRASEQYIGRTE